MITVISSKTSEKWTKTFVVSAAVVFSITGLAKVIAGFSDAHVFEAVDPIFSITYRKLFWTVGSLEIFVSLLLCCKKNMFLRKCLIAWLASNITLYRIALLLVGYHKPCGCLGSLTGVLHIPPGLADNLMKITLAYLLAGRCLSLSLFSKPFKGVAFACKNGYGKLNATITVIAFICATDSFASAYLIQGDMNTLLYLGGDKPIVRSCRFSVTLNECNFKIETVDTTPVNNRPNFPFSKSPNLPLNKAPNLHPHGTSAMVTNWIWCYDGDTYVARASQNGWSCHISPGLTVETSSSYGEVLWLAFCSGCDLKSLTNAFFSPIWQPDDPMLDSKKCTMPIRYELVDDVFNFPKQLVYLNSGFYNGYDRAKGEYEQPLSGGYGNGYTNAIYRILSYTNTGYGLFPKQSEFTRYMNVQPGYTGYLLPVTHSDITVNSVTLRNDAGDFRPDLNGGSAATTDFRVFGIVAVAGKSSNSYDYVRYTVASNLWLDTSKLAGIKTQYEAKIRGQFAAERKAVALDASRNKKRNIAKYVLIFTMSIGFVVIIYCNNIVRNKTKLNTNENK